MDSEFTIDDRDVLMTDTESFCRNGDQFTQIYWYKSTSTDTSVIMKVSYETIMTGWKVSGHVLISSIHSCHLMSSILGLVLLCNLC